MNQQPTPQPVNVPKPPKASSTPARPARRGKPIQFGPPPAIPVAQAEQVQVTLAQTPAPARQKPRTDPNLITAARELRDRYLEEVNTDPALLAGEAKYEVARGGRPAPVTILPPAPVAAPAGQLPTIQVRHSPRRRKAA